MALTGATNEEKIWNYLLAKIGNKFGVAGLMGNLNAESGLNPKNVQNSYEKKLGMNDDTYTANTDSGKYTNFIKDAAGYGLAQWTYWTRKQNLYNYAKKKGKSIGDLEMQLDFLMEELSSGYKGVLSVLKSAKTVLEASNVVLLQFERPADQSSKVQSTRASYGQKYYDKYANKSTTTTTQSSTTTVSSSTSKKKTTNVKYNDAGFDSSIVGTYVVVNATSLNVRYGPGTDVDAFTSLKSNDEVSVNGFWVNVSGTKWYLISIKSTFGFVSSKYLKKK